jgi:hypothetical protein
MTTREGKDDANQTSILIALLVRSVFVLNCVVVRVPLDLGTDCAGLPLSIMALVERVLMAIAGRLQGQTLDCSETASFPWVSARPLLVGNATSALMC